MRFSTAFFTTLTLTLVGFVATTHAADTPTPVPCVVKPATIVEQQAINDQFNDQFYISRDIVGAYSHLTSDYINHKPDITDGQLASFNFVYPLLDKSSNLSVTVQILHTSFKPPFAWVHWRADGFMPRPTAILDIYRYNGTCIVEHWDVVEEVPENPVSTHPLF
ncbi:Snoal-like polyketide cyclase family protein [Favolaschia claudopus]|uniref:Snoal-like polyketide cyclase family protein n=1 Tax=Favolaschia claudopus TaxID=2862362 RepID=A0AAW0CN81_9AGAR